ncbi:MAG: DUF749 family protein [Candidatus Hydrothermarchaeaceae archaeon]
MGKKFIATFLDVKDVDEVPAEIAPYVDFKIAHEGRKILGGERVAIFNIATTASYAVVFLDEGKTLEDVEEELWRESYAVLNPESKRVILRLLGN